jgi:hypothetical protein
MVRTCTGEVWVRNEERILHVPGRMVVGKVERLEVVVVGFDLRPFGDLEPETGEDAGDLLGDDRKGMLAPQRRATTGKGDVDALRLEFAGLFT